MSIYIQYKLHDIPSISYKITVDDGKKSLKFRQSKGNNSSITNVTLMKLNLHNYTMVINIQYKFHEIPSIDSGWKDGQTGGQEDGQKGGWTEVWMDGRTTPNLWRGIFILISKHTIGLLLKQICSIIQYPPLKACQSGISHARVSYILYVKVSIYCDYFLTHFISLSTCVLTAQ